MTPAPTMTPAPVTADKQYKVEAEDYINFYDTTTGNRGEAYKNDDVDIEVTADTDGGYNVGYIDEGEWLEFSVEVLDSASYDLDLRLASPAGGGSINVEIDGNPMQNAVSVPNTGGWGNYQTISHNIYLSAGVQSLAIYANSGGFNIDWIKLTKI